MNDSIVTDHHPSIKQQFAILTFTCFYFIRWFIDSMSGLEWTINILAILVFLPCYFIAFNFSKWTLPCSIFLVFLAIAVAPYNYGANCFAIYACSFFSYTQPVKRAVALVAATLLLLLLATYYLHLDFISFFVISAVIIFGLSLSGMIDRQRLTLQYREKKSQQEMARLAKVAERERISQDLHDVVGHSLTAIHLKSQLAEKLLQQNQSEQALEHIRDVKNSAYSALREIRQTLAGINQQGLENELEAQKDFLESIGIQFTYAMPNIPLPAKLESDILLIARESITNIVRHAKATTCSITITHLPDRIAIHIHDNGTGILAKQKTCGGIGLKGIEQRIAAHGGSVRYDNHLGLTIHIDIPWSTDDRLEP